MAHSEQPGDQTARAPVNTIDMVNKVVRTSRQILTEIGRQPTLEELAERLAMPLEKLRKVLVFARQPIRLETWTGREPDPHLG